MRESRSISLKKSDVSDSLVFQANGSRKTSDSLEKNIFSYAFDSFSQFPPFLCPRAKNSCPFLLSRSFLKSDWSDSLPSLFTKERPWANRSRCSLQKSDHEQFGQVAHDKRAMGATGSFSWANRPFAHKNERFAQKTDERIPYPGFYCNMICREQILTSRPDALNIFTFQTADKTKWFFYLSTILTWKVP